MAGYNLVLGDCRVTDCDPAIIVEGEEVFRLRQRDAEGNITVDLEVRNKYGHRLAKVVENRLVEAAPGYDFKVYPGRAEIVNTQSGTVVARVVLPSSDTIEITGQFYIQGYEVEISDETLRVGGVNMGSFNIQARGKAIVFHRDSFLALV